ncbi:Imm21 family immunity protein [Amycolatopsis sp. NPDC089917]|uniref:Imm21 family immunity protein n=1 Tax=Amycolatopsis sp. NPDC089917 TaxID=3155187 RepID=UPI00343031F8
MSALAETLPIGEAKGLVLGDEPAITCYLPEHRVFLRWLAADSEDDLLAEAGRLLADPATPWEDCGHWETDGPAVLMDSVTAGPELGVEYPAGGEPERASVEIEKGRFIVRAVHAEGEAAWVGLIRLIPEPQGDDHAQGSGSATAVPGFRPPRTTRLPPRATLDSTGTDPAITGEPPEEQGPRPQ